MRIYEFALVLTEETGRDETKAKKLVSDLVAELKGKVIDSKILGVRDLAYPIRKATRGWYGIFNVELSEDSGPELEKQVKMNEKILRHLLVRGG